MVMHTKYRKNFQYRETQIDFLRIYIQISATDIVKIRKTEIQTEIVRINIQISATETTYIALNET